MELEPTQPKNKKSRALLSGRQKGLKKFKKAVNQGDVGETSVRDCNGIWPPPFESTIIEMREWLSGQTKKREGWDAQQAQMLRTFYSKCYGLDSKNVSHISAILYLNRTVHL